MSHLASQRKLVAVGRLVVIALVAFAAIAHDGAACLPDLDLSRAKASEKGLYQVAIEPENGASQAGRAAFLAAAR